MTINPQPRYVRRIVAQTLRELGATVRSSSDMEETILGDESDHGSRSYRVGGYLASWLVEAGVVQFYDAEGHMLRAINLLEQSQGVTSAA